VPRVGAVPSWGRRAARARVGASAGEDGREGVGFFYERGEAVRAVEKNLGRHCVRRPRFMTRWVPPYLHDGLFQGQWCGYSVAYRA
jgi:hypothetical protein